MFCSNCGKQIANQAKFCNYCGAKVMLPQPQPGGSTPQPPVTPVRPAAPVKKENTWGKRFLTIALAVAVYFGAKYVTYAFLTRDVEEPVPTTSNSGMILTPLEADISLTNSCFYGALYENDYVTYGLAKLHLPGYYLLPGEGDERDWLMSNDDTCLFSAYKQLEIPKISFSASTEEGILDSFSQEGASASVVDFQKYYFGEYPVIRYIVHYNDGEIEQYIGELIVLPGETADETLRLSMYQLAETGYETINQAFDTLNISPSNALTYETTGIMGLNRIVVK